MGAVFLVNLAVNSWPGLHDEHAYWLAARRLLVGEPLYDPTTSPVTPYAYWYPPIVAQILAPVSAILPASMFSWSWTFLMLGCLWWLADRDVILALALCAFPPVAVEFMSRNVHLVLAVLIVLGIRRWGGYFSIGAAIKLATVLGLPYIALRGRFREAVVAAVFGLVLLGASIAAAPDQWRQFMEVLTVRGPGDQSTLLPIPYGLRLAAGIALMLLATRLPRRHGDLLLVVAITIALPTLWLTAFSTLAAMVPLILHPAEDDAMAAPEPDVVPPDVAPASSSREAV